MQESEFVGNKATPIFSNSLRLWCESLFGWIVLKEDFVIQSNVRRILIRSGIDYSSITFGTVKGVVYLGGVFKLAGFLTDANDDKGHEFILRNLRALERKIRSRTVLGVRP